MGQVDWSCWDCGAPGFIVHKGRSQIGILEEGLSLIP